MPLEPASLPENTPLHCVVCANLLDRGKCADPFAVCLTCRNNHRCFALPKSPLGSESEHFSSLALPLLDHQSNEAIASFWLSDAAARAHLNPQLAELLRIFLERRHVKAERPFTYCPLCGLALSHYDQPDIWVLGLRCANGHTWATRGGRIGGGSAQVHISLKSEPSDSVVAQLIRAWLKPNPHLSPQLHETIRRVLSSSPLLDENVA